MQGNLRKEDYLSARKVLNLPEGETKNDWLIGFGTSRWHFQDKQIDARPRPALARSKRIDRSFV